MYFAILNSKKLKTISNIKVAFSHNNRNTETKNADPSIKNIALIDSGPNICKTVEELIVESGATVRKNSVLAQEVFLSVSPNFFWKTDSQEGTFERDHHKVDSWSKLSFEWLTKNFGRNMVDCRLHLDEMTPHIHSIVVPLTVDNRLSARECFSRKALTEMQQSYANTLERLGIVRGIPKANAGHIKVKQYYANIAMADKILMEIPQIPCPPPRMSEEQCRAFADEQNVFYQKKLAPIVQTATQAVTAMKKQKAYQKRCAELVKDHEKLSEISRRPTIDFQYILYAFCLEPEIQNPQWWVGSGHRIEIDFDKKEFFDHRNDFRGSGLIGLVKYLLNGSFADALHWIAVQKGADEAHRCLNHEYVETLPTEKNGVSQMFRLPEVQAQYRGDLEAFLRQKSFSPALTGPLLDEKKIYPSRVNGSLMAVFLCRNILEPTGAELMGIEKQFSGMHIFSDRYDGAFSLVGNLESKRMVVCQDAIDALSFKQLHPEYSGLIISSAGVTQYPPFVDEFIEKQWNIQISFGNHDAGRAFAEKIQERLPTVDLVFPDNESWHSVLVETSIGNPAPGS